jgi:hypothetical protein
MSCPICKTHPVDVVIENSQGKLTWCPRCGSLKTFSGTVLQSKFARTAVIKTPGLLVVAADAVAEANRHLESTDRHANPVPAIVRALWSVTEALAAILHEIDARGEPAMVFPRRPALEQAIANGVEAVERERERCAKLAEQSAGFGVGSALAAKIRKGIE